MKTVIPLFKVYMSEEAIQAATEVLRSGYIGEGPKVKEFENALKYHFRSMHYQDVITCNSATSAEHLLYHMLKSDLNLEIKTENIIVPLDWYGISPDQEVLTTPLTCTATNWPILLNGIKIKWVDVDPNTMNMDLEDLQNKIGPRTRVVQLVHWGGYPNDLDAIQSIVNEAEKIYDTKILIVEDCAHAFGSKYNGVPVGFGDNLSTFSLQAIKHITAVDGGFMVSPFHNLSKLAKLTRWYGIDRDQPRGDFRCEGDIPTIGFKFHMNDVNASIGMANLSKADILVELHKINSHYYDMALRDVDGVTLLKRDKWADSAAWLYTMKVERRNDFMKHMADCNIMVSRVHERNDKHSSVQQFKTDLPKLESFIDNMVCIPVGWWVSPEDMDYIVNCIKVGW